jgi:hypothetical protein
LFCKEQRRNVQTEVKPREQQRNDSKGLLAGFQRARDTAKDNKASSPFKKGSAAEKNILSYFVFQCSLKFS